MDVSIIGANNAGRNIGKWLLNLGISITLIDKDPQTIESFLPQLQAAAQQGATIKISSLDSRIIDDIIILAIWSPKNIEIVKRLGIKLTGKTIIDISQPLNLLFDSNNHSLSTAEQLAAALPRTASVVKIYSTTLADLILGKSSIKPKEIFIASDDLMAKTLIINTAVRLGIRSVDMGPLSKSRNMEALSLLGVLKNLIDIDEPSRASIKEEPYPKENPIPFISSMEDTLEREAYSS